MTTHAAPLFSELVSSCSKIASPPWIDPVVRGLSDDSRRVQPGDLFLARPGGRDDGRSHVAEAVERGAVAVVGPTGLAAVLETLPRLVALAEVEEASLRETFGAIANRFHRRPSERLSLIGVTGTNGKTTVCFLIRQLLAAAGSRCGLMGTVLVDDGGGVRPAELTTPGVLELHATLARMLAHGCGHAAIEVSSHALDQRRPAGLRFSRAVFTNLSGDHLDYHGSMESYAAAKRRLFESLDGEAIAIVNAGDPAAKAMLEGCVAKPLSFAVIDPHAEGQPREADVKARIGFMSPDGTEILLETPWGEAEVRLPLVGRHNVENALAAIATVGSLGVPFATIVSALASIAAPPGRLEPVATDALPEDERFTVLVDYAHTDDALRRALEALRPIVPPGSKLRCLFGCGGDRDRTKRPRMAAAACSLADEVIVTSDNPRTEDPSAIVAEILTGVPAGATVDAIVDRREAIRAAIVRSARGDVLLIAGKGHEDYQIVGREKRSFDDRIESAAAIEARAAKSTERLEAVRTT
ncbi:MAG: UDP-N-acetylmuramoyl-L-alanyl-D-glutamate--2,6-diaminopimelate ligase [Phycisphaerales bacterium]